MVFEIFAHKICEECANFQLHVSIHRANLVIVNDQMAFDRIISLLLFSWFTFSQPRFQFFVKQFAELVEKLNCREPYVLSYIDLRVLSGFILSLFVNIIYKLGEQVSHQVQDAKGRDLLRRKSHQIITYLIGLDVAPLDEYFLLLADSCFQSTHPLQNVPMTWGELICFSNLNQFC